LWFSQSLLVNVGAVTQSKPRPSSFASLSIHYRPFIRCYIVRVTDKQEDEKRDMEEVDEDNKETGQEDLDWSRTETTGRLLRTR
jgi:hypothetical protein